MTGEQATHLLKVGAEDKVRSTLKRLAIPERMKALDSIIPWVTTTPKTLEFWRKHFALELGALLKAGNPTDAVDLYRKAEKG